jgi:Domain of unknown function (DUF4865)
MVVKQYLHRLPADYDIGRIRARAAERGPMWDAVPGLALKAFIVQERGQHGAVRNAYSSLYLWHRVDAILDFIFDDRFRSVIDTFGRPTIKSWLPLDVRRGTANRPTFVTCEHEDIPRHASLAGLRKTEIDRNRETANQPATHASIVALDLAAWQLARFTLTTAIPELSATAESFEIAYLATPELSAVANR